MIIIYLTLSLLSLLVFSFIWISNFKLKLIRENFKTLKHKLKVFKFMFRVILKIFKRSIIHDFSKFSKEEAPYFANAQKLNTLKYGSIEYKKCITKTLGPALKHHYSKNSHHPEHHKGGINSMGLLDQIELLCDWKAATLRTKDGDIKQSIELNMSRFGYNEETKLKYINFLKDINAY